VGGRKLWGPFPYYEAAFLGGASNLRGLPEQRFAGDAILYGSVEVRAFLARLTFILPIDLGAFGLLDVGRAYLDGESSSTWRSGRGAGVWLAPLTRSATVHVARAWSGRRPAYYAGVGFAF
jgi:hemolysin activation/secretion protein